MTEFDARREVAMLRTLKDLSDGHIQLWADVVRYDPDTGEALAEPRVRHTNPDRAPAHGVPDGSGEWWVALAERGWIAPPPPGHNRWVVTDEGRRVLTEAGLRRRS